MSIFSVGHFWLTFGLFFSPLNCSHWGYVSNRTKKTLEGSGCGTAVEHAPRDLEVLGLNHVGCSIMFSFMELCYFGAFFSFSLIPSSVESPHPGPLSYRTSATSSSSVITSSRRDVTWCQPNLLTLHFTSTLQYNFAELFKKLPLATLQKCDGIFRQRPLKRVMTRIRLNYWIIFSLI